MLVTADTTPPNVKLNYVGFNPTDIGTEVTFYVSATDNVGVTNRQLSIDGKAVALDDNSSITMTKLGLIEIIAIARDAAGNIGTATKTITVADPSDIDAPTVTFAVRQNGIPLEEEPTITSTVEIYGTIKDTNLAKYTVEIAPIDTEIFTEIYQGGSTPIENGRLALFDPSTLGNDTYILRVTATDLGGKTSSEEQIINIAGNLKLGNFRLSFTDIAIEVTGLPVNVSRTYDSLTSNTRDDLGYGWRLEFRDTDLRTSLGKDEVYAQLGLRTKAFKEGSKVFLTLPGGKREAFTFKPTRDRLSGYFPPVDGFDTAIYHPAFVGDKGVTSTLSVKDTRMTNVNGTYFGLFSGVPYNPSDSYFGGTYTLTTKEGVVYSIDGDTGDLNTVSNPNGNTLTFSDAGITSETGQAVTFGRDAQGRIVSVTDPMGLKLLYAYDVNGDLISVTDREGNITLFKYALAARPHFLTEIIDPLGRSGVRNEYDAQGRLSKMVDALGKPVQLTYDPNNSTETIKDALGNPTTYAYDLRGNIVQEIDALAGVTARTYDDENNLLSETDQEGRTKSYTYDGQSNLTSQTDGLGNTSRYTYGINSKILTSIDPLGNTTKYTLDSRGNVLSKTDALGNTTSYIYDFRGNALSITDPNGGVTRYAYNVFGNRTRAIDPLGNETTYSYDGRGNQLTETFKLTTASGIRTLTTTKTFDGNDNTTSVTDAEGNISRFEYNPSNKRTAAIDSLGRRSESQYDDKEQLKTIVFSDGKTNTYTYDAKGNRTSSTDREGRVSFITYDPLGKATQLIAPDNTSSDLTDNPRKLVTYDRAGWLKSIVDNNGVQSAYTFDAAGNITTVRNSLGDTITSTYDAARRKTSTTDALGRTTRFTYDALDRPLETIFPDNTTAKKAYDPMNNVIAAIDQSGKQIRYEYDPLNRLTGVIDPLNQRTSYAFDEAGNLVRQTDANNRITRYEYDGLKRRTATIDPLGDRAEMVYDKVGNLTSMKDFNGSSIVYDYDSNRLLVSKRFADGTATSFTYTPSGKPKTETDARGTTSYTYDANDLLTSRTEPDGKVVSYTYNNGTITSVTTPTGTTRYTYDALSRLDTAIDPSGGVTKYSYDKVGNQIEAQLPNGVVETRQYDSLNRLSLLKNSNASGTVLSNYVYTFDPVGNIKTVDELGGRKVAYNYDDLYRLTQEAVVDPTNGNRTMGYAFDPVGNRLSKTDSVAGNTTYAYDAGDRLITETSGSGITSYAYDKNGNTLSRNKNANDLTTYTWDQENRLKGANIVTPTGIKQVVYRYDANGIKVGQTVDGVDTRFLMEPTMSWVVECHTIQQIAYWEEHTSSPLKKE
jgi:large repetitive protein